MINYPFYEDDTIYTNRLNTYAEWTGAKVPTMMQAFVGDPYPVLILLVLDHYELVLIKLE